MEDVLRKASTSSGQSLETKTHAQSMPTESSCVKTGSISRHSANIKGGWVYE